MDATLHHDPFLPDEFTNVDTPDESPEAPLEPIRHADDQRTVAAVHKLIESKVDVYEGHVRATLLSDDAEPVNHTENKDSIAAVKKILDRKALANHKKRMSDVAA